MGSTDRMVVREVYTATGTAIIGGSNSNVNGNANDGAVPSVNVNAEWNSAASGNNVATTVAVATGTAANPQLLSRHRRVSRCVAELHPEHARTGSSRRKRNVVVGQREHGKPHDSRNLIRPRAMCQGNAAASLPVLSRCACRGAGSANLDPCRQFAEQPSAIAAVRATVLAREQ